VIIVGAISTVDKDLIIMPHRHDEVLGSLAARRAMHGLSLNQELSVNSV